MNEHDKSQWTLDTLKEYFESRFRSIHEAVEKAEKANEHRFDNVNEFRAQLRDQQSEFFTRAEYDRAHTDLVRQVTNLNSRMDRKEGEQTGGTDVRAWIYGSLGIIIGLAGLLFGLLKK